MSHYANHKVLCIWLCLLGSFFLESGKLQAAQRPVNIPPENFARKATISSDSGHSRDYRAKYVADGDREQLYQLIQDCRKEHGASYSQYERHLSDFKRLQSLHEEAQRELSELQRAVLLFDVNKVLAIRRHEITASHVYTYHYEGFKPGGGLYVFNVHNPEEKPLELVSLPTGQILDCDLSYDGKVVLFSLRKRENEGYHLWTIRVDGTQLKRITDGAWHDYNACWLPDGGIAFLSSRSPQFAYCWHAPVGVVYRMNADGTNIRKISSNYLNDFTPY
ncbi:MAG: TolB family protein, partial [Planctomycetota bacterium]